ncbi:FAD-binding oxidoreductase [Undibacterium cyanobacteriorum]|uniref:FAD-binding oxidoreductase n=1 Tax=Undibacterium cyanobacteriorum TaxID=3073561 RepID=A0ABY9REF2_9BURK|nr:FAD-binding oxidoreductase [Undibacterium sp. 20NA77.5]WMW79035.1 FAD-binding oxidoreductase [Undibacterium sp. 20NA77.5]
MDQHKRFLEACVSIVGANGVITDPSLQESFLREWRRRKVGRALAVICPSNTEEVSSIVRLCHENHISIVPQGGNTGLVYGGIPDESGNAIVLSLRKLNRIREIDPQNNAITVEAGCILQTIQEHAADHDRLFPLSLASEGSCTIGGNLSTNAGGTAVLRYGNTRELCLGLEIVTADGRIWNGLKQLRKDNTGYDLRDLFIGAEGTLGVITAAVMKLFPKTKHQICAFVAVEDLSQSVQFLNFLQQRFNENLTAFEIMNAFSLELVARAFPHLQIPQLQKSPFYILAEISSNADVAHLNGEIENELSQALEAGLVIDVVVTQNINQAQSCWQIRESISEAQARHGKNIKHDISLPISSVPDFVEQCDQALQRYVPKCRLVTFGHLGDGNLHYNVSAPPEVTPDDFLKQQKPINHIVHQLVHQFNGSISAEHGIGTLKKEELRLYKSELEIEMMQQIKKALDPFQIMNPGKIF